jgi:hypothetical protein
LDLGWPGLRRLSPIRIKLRANQSVFLLDGQLYNRTDADKEVSFVLPEDS